jgi:NIPSNAP protein
MWTFESLDDRERLRGELSKNEEWTKTYLPLTRGALLAQENKILSVVLPLKPPAEPGHVYELRWYRAHVGKLAEWLSLFKAVMPAREKYSKNVGVFQTEAGQLNEAVHLWAYKDLNDRAAVRSKVLQDPEWQTYLGKSAPLLADMKSIILNPAPHSPMK